MFFKKKKKEDEEAEDSEKEEEEETKEDTPKNEPAGEPSLGILTTDIEKLKAKFSSFYEMQKASNERFTRINEQIGELRGMILDRDKDSKLVEAKATQAIDLVQSVQPDKLMVELKKTDNRIEIVKSAMEINEVVVTNAVSELKDMRAKINSFKGIEESIKLAEEIKKDWIENKKIDASIAKHAGKVETIYSEMWKKFSGFERFSSIVSDLDKAVKQMASEVDSIKVKITTFSDRKKIEDLIVKFENFEKYMNNVISALKKKVDAFERDLNERFDEKMEKTSKLLKGFETLAMKTPDLDKYFDLLEEEAKKAPDSDVKVEKIKTPGKEEKAEEKTQGGFLSKLKGKFKKEEQPKKKGN